MACKAGCGFIGVGPVIIGISIVGFIGVGLVIVNVQCWPHHWCQLHCCHGWHWPPCIVGIGPIVGVIGVGPIVGVGPIAIIGIGEGSWQQTLVVELVFTSPHHHIHPTSTEGLWQQTLEVLA